MLAAAFGRLFRCGCLRRLASHRGSDFERIRSRCRPSFCATCGPYDRDRHVCGVPQLCSCLTPGKRDEFGNPATSTVQISTSDRDTRAGKDQGRTQQTRTSRGATSIGPSVTHRPEGEAVSRSLTRPSPPSGPPPPPPPPPFRPWPAPCAQPPPPLRPPRARAART